MQKVPALSSQRAGKALHSCTYPTVSQPALGDAWLWSGQLPSSKGQFDFSLLEDTIHRSANKHWGQQQATSTAWPHACYISHRHSRLFLGSAQLVWLAPWAPHRGWGGHALRARPAPRTTRPLICHRSLRRCCDHRKIHFLSTSL